MDSNGVFDNLISFSYSEKVKKEKQEEEKKDEE